MTDWRDRAACREVEPELFFPDPTAHAAQNFAIETYCNTCPVRAECLADDMRKDDRKYGIRGGLAEEERNQLRPPSGKRYRYSVATEFLPKIRRSPPQRNPEEPS